MFRSLCVGFAFLVALFGAAGADDALDALFDDYRRHTLESDPFEATGSGVYDYNDRVPSVSAEEYDRRDCPHSAAGARRRLEIFQEILKEESRVGVGKAPFPHKNYP